MTDFIKHMQHKNALFRQSVEILMINIIVHLVTTIVWKSQLLLRLSFLADEDTSACSNGTSLDIIFGEWENAVRIFPTDAEKDTPFTQKKANPLHKELAVSCPQPCDYILPAVFVTTATNDFHFYDSHLAALGMDLTT